MTFVFITLIIILFIGLILLSKYLQDRQGRLKGEEGEMLLLNYISLISEPKKVFSNIFIPKKDGSMTELDLILINTAGVHVFESKNVRGYIIGSEQDSKWEKATMKKFGLETDRTFQNPLNQNSAHIRHLSNFLRKKELKYYSYIVFSDEADLTKVKLESANHTVCHYNEIVQAVNKNVEPILSIEEINNLASKLSSLENIDKEAERKKHVKNIRAKKSIYKYKKEGPREDFGKCPECSSPLRKVTIKQGKNAGKSFFGCSSFPICKYRVEE